MGIPGYNDTRHSAHAKSIAQYEVFFNIFRSLSLIYMIYTDLHNKIELHLGHIFAFMEVFEFLVFHGVFLSRLSAELSVTMRSLTFLHLTGYS